MSKRLKMIHPGGEIGIAPIMQRGDFDYMEVELELFRDLLESARIQTQVVGDD